MKLNYNSESVGISIPLPKYNYLNRVIGADCFEELHRLLKTFGKSAGAAKEITESYSATAHLERSFKRVANAGRKPLVFHIGDGSRFYTAATTTLMTKSVNVSIDPALRLDIFKEWTERWKIRDLSAAAVEWQKYNFGARIREFWDEYGYEPDVFVTCVHAHVDLRALLAAIPHWQVCYSLACCKPATQIPDIYQVISSGDDMNILSPKRTYKVYQK